MLHHQRIGMGVLGVAAALLIVTQTAGTKLDPFGLGFRSVAKNGGVVSGGFQLGGAWEGELEGITWVGIHAPLDANGKRAAVKWQWMTGNTNTAAIFEAFGATSFSDCVGDIVMRTRDTADYRTVTYAIGTNTSGLPELKLRLVMTGTWRFLDANTAESIDTLAFYLPDGSPSGIPDQNYPAHPHYRIAVE